MTIIMHDLILEDIIDSVCGGWWSSAEMQREVWAGLWAIRTTYNRLGYRTDSEEYQDLSFLIELHIMLSRKWS